MAFLLVIAALLLTSGLWLIVDRPISSVLFLVAIVLSAWLCGFRAGIFASVISGLILDYYFVPPTYEMIASRDEIVRFILFVTEGVIISWVLDAQRRASDEVQISREQLQALSNHLQTVRESEQKRIALEIHDELGQSLTGLKMGVHWLSRQITEKGNSALNGEVSAKLSDMLSMIDSTVSQVRRIATELRPSVLDDFGLIAAIEWQITEFEKMAGIPCELIADTDEVDLDPVVSTAVFRIFQETLTNITRHAKASSVEVHLKTDDGELRLTVADDGVGINMEVLRHKRSLGLLGIRERAKLVGGSVDIVPSADGGTEVRLRVPIAIENKDARVAA
ncbi:MAG: sensor histidine kinase [Acidobacteriota bacterium]